MSYLALNLDAIAQASKTHPPTKPITMLNLFRYRLTALYGTEHSHLASPCTGEEAMTKYRTLIQPVLPPNASVLFVGVPIALVVAPGGEKWDLMVLVRYETLQGFKDMVESKEYREEVMPHRMAGLEDARLIMLEENEA